MPAIAFILITLPWLNPFSPGPTSSVGPLLYSWVCTAGLLLTMAFDRQRGESVHMVRAVALAWAAAAGLSAVIGLMQYFGVTASFGVWLNHTGLGEAYGNLRQRNQFATLLNIGLVAVLWLASSQRVTPSSFGYAPSGQWLALMTVAMAALLGAGNAASSSRTGLIQLVLVIALMLWWLRGNAGTTRRQARQLRLVLLTAALAFAVATVALPWLAGLDPFSSGAWARLRAGDAACTSRLTLWGNVLTLIGQKPWLGWGWGELDYAHFITLYPATRFCDILDNAHNLPLHLAVELGVPAALLACGAALWLGVRAQPWREDNPTRQLAWGVLAVILLHSLLEYPLWYGPFQTAAALSVWLLWWVPRAGGKAHIFKLFSPVAHYLYGLAAILSIAYCSFAAWNYHLVSQIYLDVDDRAPAYQSNTLEKIRDVWLYQDQVRFAELTTTELTPGNAAQINALAKDMLHFSPESRVVELVTDSALLLGRMDEVAFYAARYRAAFPQAYALWVKNQPPSVAAQ
jgi:O-antigen ligase